MTDTLGQRACEVAVYIIESGATVRAAAKRFGISKSTVHKDLSQRLPHYNQYLYLQVRKILDLNKAQRHIRGGMATREKYRKTIAKDPTIRLDLLLFANHRHPEPVYPRCSLQHHHRTC